jgi:dolichol-phosphate mannosyltransferase
MTQFLTIIIPSYLEEENLRLLLPRLNDTLSKITNDYEILVVDTITPKDNTRDVCILNNAKYIPRENGNNYGDAVRTGIKYANGEFTIFMDADGSHAPEFIKTLLEYKDEYDVVIASRYVKGGATDNSKILIMMSWLVNFCYSVVLNLKCKDVSNSFKLYKTAQLKELKLYSKNFEIVEEILFKLVKKNKELKIKEIPFTFKKRMFGSTKRNLFLFMLSYLLTLIKLRFGK